MAFTEILGYVSQVGGLLGIGVVAKASLSYFVQPKADRIKSRREGRAQEVDELTKLLSLTPAEAVRLHERVQAEEARSKSLSDQLTISEQMSKSLREELNAAHSEIRSLRGRMEQMDIQLSNALSEIQSMREQGRGNNQ